MVGVGKAAHTSCVQIRTKEVNMPCCDGFGIYSIGNHTNHDVEVLNTIEAFPVLGEESRLPEGNFGFDQCDQSEVNRRRSETPSSLPHLILG
eukprot:TRINITY_DN74049_c0_g1_i1.p1 TRINITY_DN74049_c0_g1~~TRINITY_DN74049_c0_g1_i1.p1  ORF type:complete len:108 (+),score=17.92 TRINITY_DN74049_c0_g1_i1:50-325(+)